MGYTHYWYIDTNNDRRKEAFGKLALDAKHLFAVAAEQGYELAGPMGDADTEPQITEGHISFNGREDGSYETCLIDAEPTILFPTHLGESWAFSCCKIGFMDPDGFRAYGDVVEALLIRAKVHYGDAIRVSSDGEWQPPGWGDWQKGAALYRIAFGEEAVCPFDPS